MASPAWFYSTIAQAAAAIIGFAIAFTISTYVSRRERMNRLTDEFKDHGREIQERYYYTFEHMSDLIQDMGNFSPPSERFNLAKENGAEELEQWANDQCDTQMARAWGYISSVLDLLDKVVSPVDEETKEQLGGLNTAAEFLHRELFNRSHYHAAEDIYREIKGLSEDDDIHGYYTQDIFDDHGEIENWLHQHLSQRSATSFAVGPPSTFSGQDLASWHMVLDEFRYDIRNLSNESIGTRASEDIVTPGFIESVLYICLGLGIFGVALPLLILIYPNGPILPTNSLPIYIISEWIANIVTLLLQLFILLPSLIFSGMLFYIMLVDANVTIPSTMVELLSVGDEKPSDEDSKSDQRPNGITRDNGEDNESELDGDNHESTQSLDKEVRDAIQRIEDERPELAQQMHQRMQEQEQFDLARNEIRNGINTEESDETFNRAEEDGKDGFDESPDSG